MAIARKIQLSSSSSSRSSSSTLPTFKSFASLMMTANNGSADSSPATSPPPTPAASIAALPSFTHSLSAFPTMTSVENDMVHYGTLGRSRDISKAKVSTHCDSPEFSTYPVSSFQLNVVLEHTKQRRDARTHVDSVSITSIPSILLSFHPFLLRRSPICHTLSS